jgi:hypothetical protein
MKAALDARQGLPLRAVKRTFKALSMKEHYPPKADLFVRFCTYTQTLPRWDR